MSLIEASASGMPVISSFHCDIPEVVVHNETGLLANEKDVSALASHLEYFVLNPGKVTEMGSNGRRHAEANYSTRKLKADLETLYLEVAGGNLK